MILLFVIYLLFISETIDHHLSDGTFPSDPVLKTPVDQQQWFPKFLEKSLKCSKAN